MDITVNPKDFKDAEAWVRDCARPSLQYVNPAIRLTAGNGVLTVEAFDGDHGARATMHAIADDGDGVTSILLHGPMLRQVAAKIPGEPVTITSGGDGSALIVSGPAHWQVGTWSAEDYPPLPVLPPAIGVIRGKDLVDAIRAVQPAIGVNTKVPALAGVRMEACPGGPVRFIASDRLRVHVLEAEWESACTEPQVCLLAPEMLAAVARHADGDVTMHLGGGLAGFSFSGRQLTGRLLAGEFPAWDHPSLQSAPSLVVRLLVKPLIECLERVSVVVDPKDARVTCVLAGDMLTVRASAPDGRDLAEETMGVELDWAGGEPGEFTLIFNPQYLAELVLPAGDTACVRLTVPEKAAVVTDGEGSNTYRGVAMPLRLQCAA
jgi:DNA polymerase III subunit beta